MPFALGLSNAGDCVDFCGALFAAYGADLVDAKGNVTVRSDAVREVLEYGQQLVKFLPRDVLSYDSASNNRALISGQSALIFNPPSAWAVAKRDQPQIAQDCWTFSAPRGPKGRFVAYNPYFWAHLVVQPQQACSEGLLEYLCAARAGGGTHQGGIRLRHPAVRQHAGFHGLGRGRAATRHGVPLSDPRRRITRSRMSPARQLQPDIAVQIYNRGTQPAMLAKLFNGQSIPQVIAWAQEELEGFSR